MGRKEHLVKQNGGTTMTKRQTPWPARTYNAATRTVVSTLGALLGVSSMNHGLLEAMQGNHPTPGLLVKALGPGHHWTFWTQGSEPAFTLVHNFLLTGLLATLAGLLILIWSLRFIHRRGGAAVFLLLSVGSFLSGGGLAQVLLFTLSWAVATRISSSLGWWRRLLPAPVRPFLRALWPWSLGACAGFFLTALEIAVVGYFPGLPRERLALDHILMGLGLAIIVAFLIAIVGAFAADIEARAPVERD
jgi:hypothetical protein